MKPNDSLQPSARLDANQRVLVCAVLSALTLLLACGDDDSGDTGGPPTDASTESYCAPTASWDASWVEFEDQVLVEVNAARAAGGDCRSEGSFPSSEPLMMLETIRCAARVHSMDMYENDYFSHGSQNGDSPGDRMRAAGWSGSGGAGENIAWGASSPADVVAGWLDSDGHCANILNPAFQYIGVGYHPGGAERSHVWTQTFTTAP